MSAYTIGFFIGSLVGSLAWILASRRLRALLSETLEHPFRTSLLIFDGRDTVVKEIPDIHDRLTRTTAP